jgi:hypothetical protein
MVVAANQAIEFFTQAEEPALQLLRGSVALGSCFASRRSVIPIASVPAEEPLSGYPSSSRTTR